MISKPNPVPDANVALIVQGGLPTVVLYNLLLSIVRVLNSLLTMVGTGSTTVAAGARAFVTDANSTTFHSTVAAGGSNKVPVVSDGANWLIG